MIELTESSIDYVQVTESVRSSHAGAVVLFLGTVRDLTGDVETASLDYEAYGEMALKSMHELREQVRRQFSVIDAAIVHRIGHLDPGEVSVAIAVSAPHRDQAIDGGRWLIDTLKQTVPIWKKENYRDGRVEWVHPGMTCTGNSSPVQCDRSQDQAVAVDRTASRERPS